jgi:hypothetical protein
MVPKPKRHEITRPPGSRSGLPVVEAEHSTQPFSATHSAMALPLRGDHEPVAEPLMVALKVIVLDKLGDDLAQMLFAQRDDALQALVPTSAAECRGSR